MKYLMYITAAFMLLFAACSNEEDSPEEENNASEETEAGSETDSSDESTADTTENENGNEDISETENDTSLENTEDPVETEVTDEEPVTPDEGNTLETTLEGTEALIPSTADIEMDTRGSDYLNMIQDDTFTNEIGYGAWEDYLEVTENYTLREYTNPDDTGSTSEEIEDLMPDNLEKNEADFSDTVHMVVYRYPDDEMYNDAAGEPSMMAEISFIFENDQLIFSSITPGYYEADISNLETLETLGQFTSIEEVAAGDPDVFTLAEINHHGYVFQQLMISAAPTDDYPGSAATAAYVIFLGDNVIQMIAYPFMDASQDFPSYSYLIYNTFIENLAALEDQM